MGDHFEARIGFHPYSFLFLGLDFF